METADGPARGLTRAAGEYRIAELAREAGITVRTLRYYQERKLLPPPRRDGRIGWYSRAHLDRLRVIGQLLDRGHTLGGIGELLTAWEQGYDLPDLLGFERAMTAPWSDEVPVPVTVDDLSALLEGQLTTEALDEAIRLGYVDVDGDRVVHVSRRLLEVTSALVREGIPLTAILSTARELQAGLDTIAASFVALVVTHVLGRHGGGPAPHEVTRLTQAIERLRPIARTALDAEFGRAMDRRARVTYDEFIRLLAARDRSFGGSGLSSDHASGHWHDRIHREGRRVGRAKDLAGEVVVVTGAARGIGALAATRLAARNARVALLGLEPGELAQVAARCGPHSRWWEVDVTDDGALADVAAAVRDAYGRVDVVVANAGIAIGGPFMHSDPRAFARVIEVNLLGSVATARAFLPALLESRGYLLQVASLAALAPAPMMAAYCASKSGVEAFAHALRAEIGHHGVRVGVAYLSWTDTDMVRGADENAALREMRAGLPFPIGRTNPAAPAVDALIQGIARRAPRVYGQRWLPPLQLARGAVPLVVARFATRTMPVIESRWLATGAPTRPVGPGGAADTIAAASRKVGR